MRCARFRGLGFSGSGLLVRDRRGSEFRDEGFGLGVLGVFWVLMF